jgi:hypothetical protein
MYATIRRYTLKDAKGGKDAIASLKQRIERNYLPKMQEVQGFHGYYVVNSNDRELTSISIFETAAGAKESTRLSAEFVRADPIKDQVSSPEVIEGELIVSREIAVGAH